MTWYPGMTIRIRIVGGVGQPTNWGMTGPAIKATPQTATVIEPARLADSSGVPVADAWWVQLANRRRVVIREDLPLVLAVEEATADVVRGSNLEVVR